MSYDFIFVSFCFVFASICNDDMKYPIVTSTLTLNITFKLSNVSVAVFKIGSLKCYLQFHNKYFYHHLVKFVQSRRVQTTQNLEFFFFFFLFCKKAFTKLTIFDISSA